MIKKTIYLKNNTTINCETNENLTKLENFYVNLLNNKKNKVLIESNANEIDIINTNEINIIRLEEVNNYEEE